MPRKNSTPARSKNQNKSVTLAEIARSTPFGNNEVEKLSFALCATMGVNSPKPETITTMEKVCRKYNCSDEQIRGFGSGVSWGAGKVGDEPERQVRKRAKRKELDVSNVADAPVVKKLLRRGCWLAATAEA